MANIGIDLGTTHSLVAVVLDGEPRALLDDEGRALVPSAVRYGDDGVPRAVGWPALDAAGEPGGITFRSIKRFMGRTPFEVRDEARLLGYELVQDDDRVVRFRVGPTAVTPMEISALVLRLLHARAEELLLSRPEGAVITVPAYFDDAQRQATRDAARLAGVEVLRLLNEPTAAAIAYGLHEARDGRKVAVYDLGGGTFDISILLLEDGVFQVLSTAGDTHLGGDDFDQALARLVLEQVGIREPDGRTFRAAMRAAERAKKRLSEAEEATVELEVAGRRIEAGIDRATFERLIRPLVERTGEACRLALSDAGLTPEDIDEVVLVGGSTRIPMVRRFVEELFRRPPHTDLDPDQVVALGAAVQADVLTGRSELADDMLLVDVVPLSLGIELMGGVVERIVPRGTQVPVTATKEFTTHVDGQTAVKIHVVQGEREMAADNRALARFTLRGLPALPAGVPRIEVRFTVDADGILHVSAMERHTGVEASVEVQPSSGLTDEEIEQMLEEAIERAETDVEKRLLVEARVEAEQVIHHLERAMREDAALLQPGEEERLRAIIADLRAAMEGEDRRRIEALTRKLDEVSAPFAQRRIERDLEAALKGRKAGEVADDLGV